MGIFETENNILSADVDPCSNIGCSNGWIVCGVCNGDRCKACGNDGGKSCSACERAGRI